MIRFSLCAVLVFLAGCYETTVMLAPAGQSKMDRALVGDWSFPAVGETKAATLVLRNLDDKAYLVQWTESGEKSSLAVGYLFEVKGVRFAQVRNLPDDGSIADKYTTLRIDASDGKLSFRNLNDKFFEGKPVDSAEKLRQVLEANLDSNDMYDGEARTGAKG
jgi:uncharacterized protein (DUF1810 family)